MNHEHFDVDVLVYEDEKEQYDQFLKYYKSLFAHMGELRFKYCYDPKKLNDELKKRPIALICDIQLGDINSSFEGLQIISEYKSQYPDVIFIAVSRRMMDIKQFGAKYPNPDLLIHKSSLKNDSLYLDYLAIEVKKLIKKIGFLEVEIEGGVPKMFERFRNKKPNISELISMMSQVVYNGYDDDDDSVTRIQKILMYPIEGGYSGSSVAKVKFMSISGETLGVPGVVKISKIQDSEQEIENYNKYVKWFLPYSWRVDVLGVGFTDKYGAVCYSFVHNDGSGAITLTELIKTGRGKESVRQVIDTLFDPSSKTWYGHIRSGVCDDITEYYNRFPYVGSSKRLYEIDDCLYENVKRICKNDSLECLMENESLSIDGLMIKMPVYLLFSQNWGKFNECICHGDLNSGNIMCDNSLKRIAFIDFQNTGYAHVFLDFISLESSIRLYYPYDKNNGVRLDLIRMISEEYSFLCDMWGAESKGDDYYECIRIIRGGANDNFSDEFESYVYGLVVVHLWLLRMGKWIDIQYYRLLSIILASLRWLEEHKNHL